MIQEGVRAGLARARSEGKRLGRLRIAPELEARIRKALAIPGRPGVRKIAEKFGLIPARCSGSAALSKRANSSSEATALGRLAQLQHLRQLASFACRGLETDAEDRPRSRAVTSEEHGNGAWWDGQRVLARRSMYLPHKTIPWAQ
jgi:hypothetical protein